MPVSLYAGAHVTSAAWAMLVGLACGVGIMSGCNTAQAQPPHPATGPCGRRAVLHRPAPALLERCDPGHAGGAGGGRGGGAAQAQPAHPGEVLRDDGAVLHRPHQPGVRGAAAQPQPGLHRVRVRPRLRHLLRRLLAVHGALAHLHVTACVTAAWHAACSLKHCSGTVRSNLLQEGNVQETALRRAKAHFRISFILWQQHSCTVMAGRICGVCI